MICRVGEAPVEMAELLGAVESPEVGGVSSFAGLVRNHSRGQKIVRIEYHAYPEMAEKKMRQVAEEIEERFGVVRLAMAHRIGSLEVGEIAVGIAAGAAHRDAAFKACRYAIDRIKQMVPIWKKEFGEGGAEWVEESPVDAESARSGGQDSL